MDQESKPSVFDLIACIFAFALIALVALFGHPTAQPDPAAMVTAQVAATTQTPSALNPGAGESFPEVPAMQITSRRAMTRPGEQTRR